MRQHDKIRDTRINHIERPISSLQSKKQGKPLQKLRQLNRISQVFTDYFAFSKAETDEEKAIVSELRYEVFCEELGFQFDATEKLESDDFDERALMCMITHKGSGQVAGTIRLVKSNAPNEYLPIEINCPTLDHKSSKHPRKWKRKKIGELSRLAVSPMFRRSNLKETLNPIKRKKSSAAHRLEKNEEIEQQCFSFISVALYCAAAVLAKQAGKEHIYIIVKPSLARSLSFIGIKFKQIGNEFEYQGSRAPYYLNSTEFFASLPTSFNSLLQTIESALESNQFSAVLQAATPSIVEKSSLIPPKLT